MRMVGLVWLALSLALALLFPRRQMVLAFYDLPSTAAIVSCESGQLVRTVARSRRRRRRGGGEGESLRQKRSRAKKGRSEFLLSHFRPKSLFGVAFVARTTTERRPATAPGVNPRENPFTVVKQWSDLHSKPEGVARRHSPHSQVGLSRLTPRPLRKTPARVESRLCRLPNWRRGSRNSFQIITRRRERHELRRSHFWNGWDSNDDDDTFSYPYNNVSHPHVQIHSRSLARPRHYEAAMLEKSTTCALRPASKICSRWRAPTNAAINKVRPAVAIRPHLVHSLL